MVQGVMVKWLAPDIRAGQVAKPGFKLQKSNSKANGLDLITR